jgi:sulfide:quinone oxidoreductase
MHVVVAGGGVAALETCMALRALAGDRMLVTLIAPNAYFEYRPIAVHDPLARTRARVPIAQLAHAAGADLRRDRVAGVDPARRRLHTASGFELSYDALVVAVGAQPLGVPQGAVAFDPRRAADCRAIVRAVACGDVGSLAFVDPPAPAQAFDLYDLALDTAVRARHDGADPALTLVTAEPAPLAIAGVRTSEEVWLTLESHGVHLVDSAYVREIRDGEIDLVPGPRRVRADMVIAAPRLGGPRPFHIPCDADGFIVVDRFGRVPEVDGVFAAGDCTAFPVKHASLAAQQADAVASAIAGLAPEPFKPVLRGMLPSRLRWYLEAPLTGGLGDATEMSAHPLWPGHARFHARHLTRELAELEDCEGADRGDDRHGDQPVHEGHRPSAAMASH